MTNAYTFKVEMIVEVLAQDRKTAKAQLDEKGGHVTERTVELLATTPLPRPDLDEKLSSSD